MELIMPNPFKGGFKTYITYSGSDASTAASLKRCRARRVMWDKKKLEDIKEYRQEFNLMNAGDLRTLPEHQAYVVTGNMHPMVLNTVPFFANRRMVRKVKVGFPSMQKKARVYSTSRVPLD